jgi:hypothetical protein
MNIKLRRGRLKDTSITQETPVTQLDIKTYWTDLILFIFIDYIAGSSKIKCTEQKLGRYGTEQNIIYLGLLKLLLQAG